MFAINWLIISWKQRPWTGERVKMKRNFFPFSTLSTLDLRASTQGSVSITDGTFFLFVVFFSHIVTGRREKEQKRIEIVTEKANNFHFFFRSLMCYANEVNELWEQTMFHFFLFLPFVHINYFIFAWKLDAVNEFSWV